MSYFSQILGFCECGCGGKVKPGNRFIHGHNRRGKTHSSEARAKMRGPRPSMQGENNPAKRPEVRAKTSGENNPAKRSEVRAKISESNSGENHPMFGTHRTEEQKQKQSERMSGEKSPRYGKPAAHSKGEWFTDRKTREIYLRSSYEIIYAKSLDVRTLIWEYEPTAFPVTYVYEGEEKHGTYCPDFYIEELDKYVEVKGYWRGPAKPKFDAFKEQYPDLKIDLVMKKEIKEIERSLKKVI